MKKVFLLSLLLTCAAHLAAQQRYLEPVFSQVNVQTVTYGSNFSIMPIIFAGGRPARQQLTAHIYSPVGDTQKCRPLIVYLKTGNFFPFPQNGGCGGALNDSSNVEFATRLAKMGYVVAVADYRGGWFPTAGDPVIGETVRRYSFINAIYRGVQDVRTCVRYFRRNVAEANNQFGIDPDKIVVWGQGTGGYVSLAAAYLNSYSEIFATNDPNKFRINGQIPMVVEAVNGDIYGTSGPCIITDPADSLANPLGIYKLNDTLCVPNHVGYSSVFRLCVNMSGALSDSAWLDDGDMPLISYHMPSDWFASCGTGLLLGIGPMPIVETTGSCDLHRYVEKYGNNDVFKDIQPAADKYGPIAKARNGGANGFFPFIGTPNPTPTPWEWTNYSGVPKPQFPGCNVNSISARAYIDTIIGYYAPRGYIVLGLESACPPVSADKFLPNESVQMTIVPNPAIDEAILSVPEGLPFQSLQLFDASGRLVRSIQQMSSSTYALDRAGLPSGVYVVKACFEKGVLAQKLVFE